MTLDYLVCSSIISWDGKYRYNLLRVWDKKKPKILYLMLNPSTADGSQDDPTIRSCVRLAKGLGYGGFEVVNLMAYRATKPKELPSKPSIAMGPGNARAIEEAAERCTLAIAAWGAHPYAKRFVDGALDILELCELDVYCFGTSKDGSPKHPLYIKSGTALEAFRRRA
jgi:hypothetical protein